MKLRSAVSIVIGMILSLGLIMPAHIVSSASQSTTVNTAVPDSHTVTVSCQGEGRVQVKGERYTSYTFHAPRLEPLTVQIKPPQNCKIDTVTTRFGFTIQGNKIILDPIYEDGSVEVSFKPIGRTPAKKTSTADTTGGSRSAEEGTSEEARQDVLQEVLQDPSVEPTEEPEVTVDETEIVTVERTENETEEETAPEALPMREEVQTVRLSGDGGKVDLTFSYQPEVNEVKVHLDEETVRELIEKQESDNVTLDLKEATRTQPKVSIPRKMIEMISESTGCELVLDNAQVRFDRSALKGIAKQAAGEEISLEVLNVESAKFSTSQQKAMGGTRERIAITIQLTDSSGNVIRDFDGGTATITLPYVPEEYEDTTAIEVWYLPTEGDKELVPCEFVDGQVVFVVDHFSEYVVIAGPVRPPSAAADEEGESVSLLPILFIIIGIAVLSWIFFILWKRRKKEDEEQDTDGM